MARLANAKGWAALLLVVLLVLFVGPRERRQSAYLEGYVYQRCSGERLVGPVEAAIVSTSVDAITARTDINGHFQMRTGKPVFADEFYNVSVRAGDITISERTMLKNGVNNLPRQVSFVLSPPEPVMAQFDQSRHQVWCHVYHGRPPGNPAAKSPKF